MRFLRSDSSLIRCAIVQGNRLAIPCWSIEHKLPQVERLDIQVTRPHLMYLTTQLLQFAGCYGLFHMGSSGAEVVRSVPENRAMSVR
jgi:hypothetical protein